MEQRLKEVKNHVIVCGFGRNGRKAALDLLLYHEHVVVIENNNEAVNEIIDIPDLMYVKGNATSDEVLNLAMIREAKAIITTLPHDADNLFVVLSARDLRDDILIISRASQEKSDQKLRRAGADNIIMPDKIGGQQMAKLVTNPDTIDFLEFVLYQKNEKVNLSELYCKKVLSCNLNRTIAELDIRKKTGANILGLKNADGTYIFNPSSDIKLTCDDHLFVLATSSQLKSLKDLLYKVNI